MEVYSKIDQKIALIAILVNVFLDNIFLTVIVPTMPQYIKSLGLNDTAVGVFFSCYAIGLLLTTPIWGIVSDRFGRKTPIVYGLMLFILSTLLFAFSKTVFLLFAAYASGDCIVCNMDFNFSVVSRYFSQE